MNRLEAMQMESLQDSWTIMYTFLARILYDEYSLEGESALREAIRRFGRDRGLTNRQRLLDNNIKINLETLYCEGRDRPGDPRFVQNSPLNTREEKIDWTFVCPDADLWRYYHSTDVGRIYCEEFHHACYEAFTFDIAKINLTRTLTQEGDDRCSFYFTFRAENVPDELKPLCFEEYDPGYVKPTKPMPKPQGKSGFNMLWLKLYYYFVEVCCERFGEKEGHKIVAAGLTRVAREHALYYQAKAQSIGRIADAAYVTANIALSFNISEEPMWAEKYGQHNAPELLEKYFFEELFSLLKIKDRRCEE